MNNFEADCFAFVEDILINRPKNIHGDTAKYCKEDREKIIELLSTQINMIENNRSKMSQDCYALLNEIFSGLLSLFEKEIV